MTPKAVHRRLAEAELKLAHANSARAPVATEHQQLQRRILRLEGQLAAPAEPAARWSGRPVATVAAELAVVEGQHAVARDETAVARSRQQEAAARVAAVRRGDGGSAGARLHAAGVAWQLLHDGVALTEAGRARFEPLLRPFDGALCVAPRHREVALAAVADLPGVLLVAAEEAPLPPEVLAAPPGAAGLLSWLDLHGQAHPHGAVLAGVLTVTGGFPEPTTGHTARARAAERALRDAEATLAGLEAALERLDHDERALAAEHEAAVAVRQHIAITQELDRLRGDMAMVVAQLQPLNDAVEDARNRKAKAEAELEGLVDRRGDLTAHLATCRSQLTEAAAKVRELAETASRYQLPAWLDHLPNAAPSDDPTATAPRVAGADLAGLDLLQLPPELTSQIRAHATGMLASGGGPQYRDYLVRLEGELSIDVNVTIGRTESTQARVTARHGELDVVVRLALERYHVQAAVVDRRRSRDSEEREIAALDQALDALAAWLGRQADTLQAALTRAEAHYEAIRLERDEAQDELTANHAKISNIQRGLEHQARGLFEAVSTGFNEIRWRDGGYGGKLDYEIAAPPLELSPDGDGEVEDVIRRRWRLTVTPRWARRPPDHGTVVDHIPYRDQANTAQYKLATVQIVLAALLANADPTGRVLILDELGDGLGDAHRDRVLGALHRAATETGITILVTVQDDMQHEAFERSAEVLVLRYASEQDLLNEPTRMLSTRHREDGGLELIPLADALTSGRGPGWSALLSAFDAIQAQRAAAMQQAAPTQEPSDGDHDGDTEDDDRAD
jgi:predicted  nucleic acid-binding Zn-ribbon protein